MTVAGGRVVSRPMNGAIEGMLAVLEDPRAEQADAAVAGLVDRYYVQGAGVLRPFKVRFRKMLSDRDPGVRRVAAWALAHTGDLDVVPILDRRHGRCQRRRRRGHGDPPGSPTLEPQDRRDGPAEPVIPGTSVSPRRGSGASGIKRSGRSTWRDRMTMSSPAAAPGLPAPPVARFRELAPMTMTDARSRREPILSPVGDRAHGAGRVEVRPGDVVPDGGRPGCDAGRGLAGPGLCVESGLCVARDGAAPDHRGRRGRRQSRGDAGLDGESRRRGGRRGGDGVE